MVAPGGRVRKDEETLDAMPGNGNIMDPSQLQERNSFRDLPRSMQDCGLSNGNSTWTVDVEQNAMKADQPATRKAAARASGPPPAPITLKFEDVVYTVTLKSKGQWWNPANMVQQKGTEKEILKGITGTVKPGEMLAMMGPSGSGKTSLLSILGGRVASGNLSGTILYNDLPYNKAVKRRTGFVTQDDILHVHLTVKETLVYAALLRLPSDTYNRREKVGRAEEIIVELGLEKCQDVRIGDTFVRGISGGERKRVSIGFELIVDPSLLLLDEPTSGLDSTTASRIITTLQKLANAGRTVVTTIHQPSSRVYHMFNKIILLSGGRALYYGQASEAIPYFASLGFPPVLATNPADYILDLANGVTHDMHPGGDEGLPIDEAEELRKQQTKVQAAVVDCLSDAYQRLLNTKAKEEVHSHKSTEQEIKALNEKVDWPTSWVEQFTVLLVRGLKERRHEAFGVLRVTQVLAISFICGLLWFHSTTAHIQDQLGLLFFFSTFWGFFPLFSALFTFPQERKMLIKERTSGMYRLSSYFFARTLGDLPLEFVLPILFIIIVYWMGGLKPAADTFFLSMLVLLYNVLVSQGLGLFLGAAVMETKQATTLASVIMLLFLLAGGFYVQRTPPFIAWVKYLSFSYYCFKIQLSLQFDKDQTYPCASGVCRVEDFQEVKNVGLGHVGTSLLALTLMMLGYRFLCYLALRRLKGFK